MVEQGQRVLLSYARIPKATTLQLEPCNGDYLRWSNQKAVLETTIKDYGTVTLDTSILIDFQGEEYRFRVAGLEPGPHASLIDTDVTVDMIEEVRRPVKVEEEEREHTKEETKREAPEELVSPVASLPLHLVVLAGSVARKVLRLSLNLPRRSPLLSQELVILSQAETL